MGEKRWPLGAKAWQNRSVASRVPNRAKNSAVRAASSKRKRAPKKHPSKTTRRRASRRIQAQKRSQHSPVVQDTIVDIVDEPVRGVVRVTEIEEVSVAMPGEEDED